jgi:hypothetical protein
LVIWKKIIVQLPPLAHPAWNGAKEGINLNFLKGRPSPSGSIRAAFFIPADPPRRSGERPAKWKPHHMNPPNINMVRRPISRFWGQMVIFSHFTKTGL